MKSSCNPNECHLWSGLILFVVGAIFLLQKLDVVPETTWTYLWPAMLIVVGLKLMMASGSSCCGSGMCETP
ncbi:hypothetical protein HOH67_00275, partial [Candidatus Peregrinibacteria bacterium]|nr:hypothetical protein [Candidatus Peregrinibacteria bacterium]